MTVKAVLNRHPRAASVFFKMGMYCVGCPAEAFHTLEEAARAHHLDPEALIRNLNQAIFGERSPDT